MLAVMEKLGIAHQRQAAELFPEGVNR